MVGAAVSGPVGAPVSVAAFKELQSQVELLQQQAGNDGVSSVHVLQFVLFGRSLSLVQSASVFIGSVKPVLLRV